MTKELPGGYNGKILRVNLSNRTTSVEEFDENFCRKYIGGAGFVAYYLYKELRLGINPLGPDNKFIWAMGPLTGVALCGCTRSCFGAKSPLTGGVLKSEPGGACSAELKRAGFDGIIIEGKAEKPVYLWITDGKATIRDASHLWGKQTKETLETIREELGDKRIQAAMIGPAGENQVLYACVMDGLVDAAGRGGAGAVMGSKNLKAIAARGHGAPRMVSPEGVKEVRNWVNRNMKLWARLEKGRAGTGQEMEAEVVSGNVAVNNWRDGLLPDAKLIDCSQYLVGLKGCFACPIRCHKVMKFKGQVTDPAYGGPEYETIGAIGTACGVTDVKAITNAAALCNANGLDTISTGMTIAFAMECFEYGLLTKEDTGGIDLRFGNGEALVKTVELISKRQGIGELLSQGSLRTARRIGKGAEEFAMQVKGLEIPMHDPRVKPGLGLGYMVNPHGPDHVCNIQDPMYTRPGQMMNFFKPEGILEPFPLHDIGPRKVALFRLVHFREILLDSLLICQTPHNGLDTRKWIADTVEAVTGWENFNIVGNKAAERILTTFRLINVREGFTAEDDKLPERFYQKKPGNDKCVPLDHEKMERAKSYYYTLMGWDPRTGIPLPEKVEELGVP